LTIRYSCFHRNAATFGGVLPGYEDDESRHPTLDAFQEQTDIQVTYTEDINDNDEFFGKVQNQLTSCQPTGRDIIVLTGSRPTCWRRCAAVRAGCRPPSPR
jgi:hypothetical protein